MNLYLLERIGGTGWDQFDSFVVAAADSRQARKLTVARAGRYDRCDWGDPAEATCRKIGTARAGIKAGVVIGSFNAG
jgi:hypothetical protein